MPQTVKVNLDAGQHSDHEPPVPPQPLARAQRLIAKFAELVRAAHITRVPF
jgi:hypothetical protein